MPRSTESVVGNVTGIDPLKAETARDAMTGLLRAHYPLVRGRKDCTCGWSVGPYMPVHFEEHLADVAEGALAAAWNEGNKAAWDQLHTEQRWDTPNPYEP